MEPDPDKQIDLDPSEWSRDKPLHQRVLTPEGRVFLKHFAILFAVGMAISIPMSILVYGGAPYWIDDYITFEWDGLDDRMSPVGAVILTCLIIGVLLGLDGLLRLLRRLRG